MRGAVDDVGEHRLDDLAPAFLGLEGAVAPDRSRNPCAQSSVRVRDVRRLDGLAVDAARSLVEHEARGSEARVEHLA